MFTLCCSDHRRAIACVVMNSFFFHLVAANAEKISAGSVCRIGAYTAMLLGATFSAIVTFKVLVQLTKFLKMRNGMTLVGMPT